jgi:uncharacterized membrane protein
MRLTKLRQQRFLVSLTILTFLCLGLFIGRVFLAGDFHFLFIPFNLALAWASIFFAALLASQLKAIRWQSGQNILLTALWLIFLPNAWYVLTDFIHVNAAGEVSELYDIVLMFSLTVCGFTLGFASLYIIHLELLKRLKEARANWIIAGVLLLSSFGIYLGRDLRWNSWDVISNPGGLLLNVSDRVVDPLGHPRALNVTILFFILLCATYFSFWYFVRPIRRAG